MNEENRYVQPEPLGRIVRLPVDTRKGITRKELWGICKEVFNTKREQHYFAYRIMFTQFRHLQLRNTSPGELRKLATSMRACGIRHGKSDLWHLLRMEATYRKRGDHKQANRYERKRIAKAGSYLAAYTRRNDGFEKCS